MLSVLRKIYKSSFIIEVVRAWAGISRNEAREDPLLVLSPNVKCAPSEQVNGFYYGPASSGEHHAVRSRVVVCARVDIIKRHTIKQLKKV